MADHVTLTDQDKHTERMLESWRDIGMYYFLREESSEEQQKQHLDWMKDDDLQTLPLEALWPVLGWSLWSSVSHTPKNKCAKESEVSLISLSLARAAAAPAAARPRRSTRRDSRAY